MVGRLCHLVLIEVGEVDSGWNAPSCQISLWLLILILKRVGYGTIQSREVAFQGPLDRPYTL